MIFFNLFYKMNKQISLSIFFIIRASWRFVDRIDFFKTIFYLEIIFSESESSSKLTSIKRDCFHEITQIIMICQFYNRIMIVFKIMSSLLKYCDNKKEFLIMRLVSDLNKNHFLWIKDDRMSLRLFYVDHERYKLKQNRWNDKFWYINFYSDEISKIKMNQYERFYKRFDELSKRLSRDFFKDEWLILFLLLTFFKQFCCHEMNSVLSMLFLLFLYWTNVSFRSFIYISAFITFRS